MAGVYYWEGEWFDKSPKLTGLDDHAFWLASTVFDGARAFNGLAPDLDLHCQRCVRSAVSMLLSPTKTAEEIEELCIEGIRKMPRDTELYVRPMFFGTTGFLIAEPEGTKFALTVYEMALPGFTGFSATLVSQRRPAPDQAPTDAKASCLYPNSQRAIMEARDKGFEQAILLDPDGNVSEFASSNIWIVKDGVALTPVENGTFLSGVTRKRVKQLLADDGVEVVERSITYDEVTQADEIFSTGNYGKVMPVTRIEDRDLQPGPIATKASELYFEYAKSCDVYDE